jgi:hypothetical protein
MSGISGTSGVGAAASYATVPNVGQSTTTLPSVFANLNLTQGQQQQLSQILQNAKNGNLTSTQLQNQIDSVLDPQQLAQLKSELHHHHHHHASQSSSSSSSTSGSTSDEDAFGVTIPTSTSSPATQSIANAAATFWAQSQITPQSET